MKRNLSYQEFLKMDFDLINARAYSLTEYSLYYYNIFLNLSPDICEIDCSIPTYFIAGEYQFLFDSLKSAFEEVFSLSKKKKWQKDFRNYYHRICDALSEFNKEDANYIVVSQDTFNSVMDIAVCAFHILKENGYDLERFYLADIYSTL